MPRLRPTPQEDPRIAFAGSLRQRILATLAVAGAPMLMAPTGAELEATGDRPLHGSPSRLALATALAAGLGGAGLAIEKPAHAETHSTLPDMGEVYYAPKASELQRERERIPEWSLPELERMADVYSLLSSLYINPSFWWHVHTQGFEPGDQLDGPVYKALGLAIQHPELLYYRTNPDGSLSLVPRVKGNTFPADFEILIRGGVSSGGIDQIKMEGRIIRLKRDAYLSWDKYAQVMASILQPEAVNAAWMHSLEQIINGRTPDIPIEVMANSPHDPPRPTIDNLRNKREYERMLPHLIGRLWQLRRESPIGVLNPATDNSSPAMENFLDRLKTQPQPLEGDATLDSVVKPEENSGVIEIREPIMQKPVLDSSGALTMDADGNLILETDPNAPTILAVTTDGRIVRPEIPAVINTLQESITKDCKTYNDHIDHKGLDTTWKLTKDVSEIDALEGEIDAAEKKIPEDKNKKKATTATKTAREYLNDLKNLIAEYRQQSGTPTQYEKPGRTPGVKSVRDIIFERYKARLGL